MMEKRRNTGGGEYRHEEKKWMRGMMRGSEDDRVRGGMTVGNPSTPQSPASAV